MVHFHEEKVNIGSICFRYFYENLGLQIGAESCENDDLLFFCDIDMLFSADFFQRLLANVTPGVAFYPIVFSQYDPAHVGEIFDNFDINEMTGFWRKFGYGMIALYKSDFDKAGGFDVKIEGTNMNFDRQWRCRNIHVGARAQALAINRLIFRLGFRRCVLGDKCD